MKVGGFSSTLDYSNTYGRNSNETKQEDKSVPNTTKSVSEIAAAELQARAIANEVSMTASAKTNELNQMLGVVLNIQA